MHILPIIPARFESERFPGKLLKEYQKRTIINYPIRACLNVFGECFVVSDGPELVYAAYGLGASGVLLSGNYRNGTERIADACNRLNITDDTLIMHVQGDEVELDPEDLKRLAAVAEHNYVSTLYYRTEDEKILKSLDHVKCWMDEKERSWRFTRAYPGYDPWAIHVGVYCYKRDALRRYMTRWPTGEENRERLEQLRWDVPISAYEVKPCKSINVPGDLE